MIYSGQASGDNDILWLKAIQKLVMLWIIGKF
jgi:hypothetical protein